MSQLHEVVTEHLRAKRESGRAVGLWNKLWSAFEEGGADSVGAFVEGLAELPDETEDVL